MDFFFRGLMDVLLFDIFRLLRKETLSLLDNTSSLVVKQLQSGLRYIKKKILLWSVPLNFYLIDVCVVRRPTVLKKRSG